MNQHELDEIIEYQEIKTEYVATGYHFLNSLPKHEFFLVDICVGYADCRVQLAPKAREREAAYQLICDTLFEGSNANSTQHQQSTHALLFHYVGGIASADRSNDDTRHAEFVRPLPIKARGIIAVPVGSVAKTFDPNNFAMQPKQIMVQKVENWRLLDALYVATEPIANGDLLQLSEGPNGDWQHWSNNIELVTCDRSYPLDNPMTLDDIAEDLGLLG